MKEVTCKQVLYPHHALTTGKKYKVIKSSRNAYSTSDNPIYYSLTNDFGDTMEFDNYYFKSLQEVREEKLTELGI